MKNTDKIVIKCDENGMVCNSQIGYVLEAINKLSNEDKRLIAMSIYGMMDDDAQGEYAHAIIDDYNGPEYGRYEN